MIHLLLTVISIALTAGFSGFGGLPVASPNYPALEASVAPVVDGGGAINPNLEDNQGDKKPGPQPQPGNKEPDNPPQPPASDGNKTPAAQPNNLPTSCDNLPQGSQCSTNGGVAGTCRQDCTLFIFCGSVTCQANPVPTENNKQPLADNTACTTDGQECITGTNRYKGICRHGGFFGFTGLTSLECQSTGEPAAVTPQATPPAACLALFDLNHDGAIDQAEYDAIVKRRNQHSLNNSQNALVDGGACKPGNAPASAQNPLTKLPSIANAQKDPFTNKTVPSAAECGPVIALYDTNPRDGALSEAEIAEATKLYTARKINDDQYFKILACREGGTGATPPTDGGTPPPPPNDSNTNSTLPGGQGPPKHVDVPGMNISPTIYNDVNGDGTFTKDDCALLLSDFSNKGITPTDVQFDFSGDHPPSVGTEDVKACEAYFNTPPPAASSSIPVSISCTPPTTVGLKAGDTITCGANAQPAAGHAIASYAWRATFPPPTGTDQTFTFSVPSNQSTGLLTVTVTSDDNATGTSAPMSFIFPAPAGQTTTPPGGGGTASQVELKIWGAQSIDASSPFAFTGVLTINGIATDDWTGAWSSQPPFSQAQPNATSHDYNVTAGPNDQGHHTVSLEATTTINGQSQTVQAAPYGFDVTLPASAGQATNPPQNVNPTVAISPKLVSATTGQTVAFSATPANAPANITYLWTSSLGQIGHNQNFTFTAPATPLGAMNVAVAILENGNNLAGDQVVFSVVADAAPKSAPAQFIVKVSGPTEIQAGGSGYTYTAAVTTADGQMADPARLRFQWSSPFTPPSFNGSSYTVSVDALFYLSNFKKSYTVKVQATDNAGGTGAGESNPIKVLAL